MGIGADVDPKLVETHITGYGLTGPYSRRPGIDPLAQALMGLSRAQGGSGNPPSFAAQLAPTDFTAGAMGALGTVLALYARRRGGRVRRVDSNLLNAAVVLSAPWFGRWRGKVERPPADGGQHGVSAFHRLYRVADGWVYVAADSAAAQAALVGRLGLEGLDAEGAGHPAESPLALAIAEALAGRRLAEVLAGLGRSRRSGGGGALRRSGGSFSTIPPPPPTPWWPGPCIRRRARCASRSTISASTPPPPRPRAPTPLLGEHGAEALAEAGLEPAEIEALFASGALLREEG